MLDNGSSRPTRRVFLTRVAALAAVAVPMGLLEGCLSNQPAASPTSGSSAPAAANPTSDARLGPTVVGGVRKIKYGDLKSLGDCGIYVAIEQGYFREQGLDVEINSFDSAANMVAPLGAGQLDAAGGAISAGLFNALARNINMKIVADKGHSEPTPPGYPVSIFLARKPLVDGGQVKGAADLKGRKFGWVARGISTELDLQAFLQSGGLTVNDINLTQMGFPEMVAAMASGGIDACAPPDPFATNMVGNGTAAVIGYDYQVNPRNQVAAVFYSADFAKTDLGTRFMLAYLRGVRLYNDAFVKKLADAREKVIAAAVKYTTVKDPALYDRMQLQGLSPDGTLNVATIMAQQEYFLNSGAQQTRVNLDNFIDTHFAKEAVDQLGPYA